MTASIIVFKKVPDQGLVRAYQSIVGGDCACIDDPTSIETFLTDTGPRSIIILLGGEEDGTVTFQFNETKLTLKDFMHKEESLNPKVCALHTCQSSVKKQIPLCKVTWSYTFLSS